MSSLSRSGAALALALVIGCGAHPLVNPTGTGKRASALIGPAGGELTLEGTTLHIPEGALTSQTQVSIVSNLIAAPPRYSSSSPVFRFEPTGVHFAKPVGVTFTSEFGPGGHLVVFWSKTDSATEFESIISTEDRAFVEANVNCFGTGFIAEAESNIICEGSNCMPPTTSASSVPGQPREPQNPGTAPCADGSCDPGSGAGGGGGGLDFGGPNCPGNICSPGTGGGGGGAPPDLGTGGGIGGGPNCPGNICG